MKIVVLHDDTPPTARPDELDGLVQVREVSQALEALGHEPVAMPFTLNLQSAADRLRRLDPDLVFNLVESVEGHGRLIYLAPALLDALEFPYTGASTDAMYTTSNKVLAKRLLSAGGLDTPAWMSRGGELAGHCEFPGRYIIKSVWEDASVGLDDSSVVDADDERTLADAIQSREARLGGEGFAESFVEGREFNISLLQDGDRATTLPVAEIRFDDFPPDKPKIVGYSAKWDEASFEYTHTPRSFEMDRRDAEWMDRLAPAALRCWDVFGLRGYARVDFRVDSVGRAWILEINANPCLSSDAGLMAAAGRAGISQTQVIERIVSAARLRTPVA